MDSSIENHTYGGGTEMESGIDERVPDQVNVESKTVLVQNTSVICMELILSCDAKTPSRV